MASTGGWGELVYQLGTEQCGGCGPGFRRAEAPGVRKGVAAVLCQRQRGFHTLGCIAVWPAGRASSARGPSRRLSRTPCCGAGPELQLEAQHVPRRRACPTPPDHGRCVASRLHRSPSCRRAHVRGTVPVHLALAVHGGRGRGRPLRHIAAASHTVRHRHGPFSGPVIRSEYDLGRFVPPCSAKPSVAIGRLM